MLPLKYDLVKLGGSWAQRQVFSVTLIHAAIRSNQLPLALALIAELKVCKRIFCGGNRILEDHAGKFF